MIEYFVHISKLKISSKSLLKLQFLKQIDRLDKKWRIQIFTGPTFPGNQQDFHGGCKFGSWSKQGENDFKSLLL